MTIVPVREARVFFRWRARAKDALLASDHQQRLAAIERALTVRLHDAEQAAVDHQESEAVALVLGSLANAETACVKAGSLVIIKLLNDNGSPAIFARTLSPIEMRALDRYPELQTEPAKFFDALGLP